MQCRLAARRVILAMKPLFAVTAMLIGLLLSGFASREPLATVPVVDPARYAGKWHEIAKLPNWFQRRCASDTTATYTLLEDGRIRVVNRCRAADGSWIEADGVATPVDGSGNARLKVRFGFVPFAGDYWIIGLDRTNYSWTLVGHPSRNYLWILARGRQLDDATYDHIIALAASKGYDVANIEKTPQPGTAE
jgi:apolipoprotein D and lipocalin family protein